MPKATDADTPGSAPPRLRASFAAPSFAASSVAPTAGGDSVCADVCGCARACAVVVAWWRGRGGGGGAAGSLQAHAKGRTGIGMKTGGTTGVVSGGTIVSGEGGPPGEPARSNGEQGRPGLGARGAESTHGRRLGWSTWGSGTRPGRLPWP